jgi:hypothetical protein
MNSRSLSISLLLALLISSASFALPAGFVPAMTALDKKYIPALGLSGQPGQMARAKLAFESFDREWEAFALAFGAEPGFDAEWRADLERIGDSVARARTALLGNSDGPAAHEALEGVRMGFLESRSRQKIPYFLDSLTLFHNSMEELLNGKPAKGMKDWSEAERLGFSADLDLATARWKKARAMEGLLPAAELSPTAAAAYAGQRSDIDAILAGAKAAFEAGDERALPERLGQLKPNFIKAFFLFGDFPR